MTRKFLKWWEHAHSKNNTERQELFERWLRYAAKTVAIRGNQDQQRIVYTIQSRFANSTFRRISRSNAWRIWSIVNQKQAVYRSMVRSQNPTTPQRVKTAPTIVVKKKNIQRHIIRGAGQ